MFLVLGVHCTSSVCGFIVSIKFENLKISCPLFLQIFFLPAPLGAPNMPVLRDLDLFQSSTMLPLVFKNIFFSHHSSFWRVFIAMSLSSLIFLLQCLTANSIQFISHVTYYNFHLWKFELHPFNIFHMSVEHFMWTTLNVSLSGNSNSAESSQ